MKEKYLTRRDLVGEAKDLPFEQVTLQHIKTTSMTLAEIQRIEYLALVDEGGVFALKDVNGDVGWHLKGVLKQVLAKITTTWY